MREQFHPINDRWIKWKDIERCPYAFRDAEYSEWNKNDDERLFLAALDNYADYLQSITVSIVGLEAENEQD